MVGDLSSIEQRDLFDEVLKLNSDSRLHCAVSKFEILKLSLAKNENYEISEELKSHAATLNRMISRASDASDVLAMGNVDESWILGVSMFGTTTHYKLLDGGSMMIRLEGDLDDLPMFEQLAVIHEVDLFHEWVPFCCTSRTITKLSPVELIAYFGIYLPPISRDALLRAYAVDCLFEEGKILLIGSSIDDWPTDAEISSDPTLLAQHIDGSAVLNAACEGDKPSASEKRAVDLTNAPWRKAPTYFHNRMIIKDFKSILHITGPNAGKTVVVAQVDPRIPLPQRFINFVIKNLAGVFLSLFQRQVVKVAGNPDSSHGKKIRQNRPFYEDWLLPRLRTYCEQQKWPYPNVSSLDVAECEGQGKEQGKEKEKVKEKEIVEGLTLQSVERN